MSEAVSFEQFQNELNRLVSVFDKGFAEFTSPEYSEARVRQDFLDPLFRALGWDIENKRGLVQSQREVEIESRTDVAGRAKRADYLFRAEGRERFVCEAKKPREILGDRYAFQTKRYAWNKGLPLAVLSDFEEIKIYVVGGKPNIDRAEEGLWQMWNFRQFPLVAQQLWDVLARERIAAGSIETLLDSLPKKKPAKGKARQQWLIRPDRTKALDQDFLEYLDEQRRALASDLFSNNAHEEILADGRLNEASQRILDRLLFLRICEDRDIDTGIRLSRIVETWRRAYGHEDTRKLRQGRLIPQEERATYNCALPRESLWWSVVSHLRALDRRPPGNMPFFNGNLFKPHFSENLRVGDQWLCDFIEDISADESPYLFSVIPVEILGSVYERFLGKVVRPHGRGITIEEKPEVRKAGGVYYTPRYIVDYIVEQTVGRQLDTIAAEDNKFAAFDKKTRALRILDPACGSGSFLIRVFERVCEHYQRRFTAHPEDRKPVRCWIDPATGDVHLTVDLKRRILRDNIYGVDLDAQAVEVTQLSLYLKMLEGEDRTSIKRQRELFREEVALLPPLEDNIKHGNSLIASDFSLVPEDLIRVHAFDWNVQYADIMKAGGFDAVIGNPPYIRIQTMKDTDAGSVQYFKRTYSTASHGSYDIYVLFVERGLSLVNNRGACGFILPNKFLNAEYGAPLREILGTGRHLSELVHFSANQVFEGATTYTCLLFLSKAPRSLVRYHKVGALDAWRNKKAAESAEIASSKLGSHAWSFSVGPGAQLEEKLKAFPVRLGDVSDIFVGLQTSADDVFIMNHVRSGDHLLTLYSECSHAEVTLEKELLHPIVSGTDVKGYDALPSRQYILFPYDVFNEKACLLAWRRIEEDFPRVANYLKGHRARLSGREKGRFRDSQWYRFGRSQNLGIQNRRKICVPRLVDRLCAAGDLSGSYFLDNVDVGGVTWKDGFAVHDLRFLLALLNSRLLGWFFPSISAPFRGGWMSANRQFLSQLPFKAIDFSNSYDRALHDKLVELVGKMLALAPKLRAETSESKKKTLQNAVDATDRQIDALVYELYGLTPEEIKIVEGEGRETPS